MTTLHVDRKGASLDIDGGSLVIRGADGVLSRIPLGPLERVVVRAHAELSTRVLAELWQRGIGLLVLSGRHGEATARLLGRPHGDAALRVAQYRLALDETAALPRARALVEAKVRGQARLMRRALAARPDHRLDLLRAIETLDRIGGRLAPDGEATSDRAALSGLEGAAAAAYFAGYATLFPPSLGFAGRRRRPPPDPVNVGLSLGYTLLHHEAVREAQVCGLDPLLGFLHVAERGRESLASDLIEPLRPHVDEWVWRCFADRILRAEHFSTDPDGACLMGKAGRTVFYTRFEPLAMGLRRLLRAMARHLAADLRRNVAA